MTNTLLLSASSLILGALLGGCVVTTYQGAPPPSAVATEPPLADEGIEEQAPEAPPPLPVYEQPPCPVEGYIWTPGVWRWGAEGYYWVPGTWVAPPAAGMLWTPGYWAVVGEVYEFRRGYWGRHVGYYGGIDYGAGYDGDGYRGGRWVNNRFQYNTTVTNVNVVNVHSVYRERVINNLTVNNAGVARVSYVGGPGTRLRPNAAEAALTHQARYAPTQVQTEHHNAALGNPALNAARNEGRPPIAATPRAGAFTERGFTAAKPVGPAYHPQHAPPRPEQKGEKEQRGHEGERPR
jgi:hypothetical protein